MTDEPPPSRTHKVCSCCGGEVQRRKPGAKARGDAVEWRAPGVIAAVKEAGRRLKWVRNKLDLTQSEVADMANTSVNSIQHVENGRPKDIVYSFVIARAIGCPFSRLWVTSERWERFVVEKLHVFEQRRKENLSKLEDL